jgi:hypothetical protein
LETELNFVGFLKSCARLGGASSSKKRFRSTLSGLERVQLNDRFNFESCKID